MVKVPRAFTAARASPAIISAARRAADSTSAKISNVMALTL
jgi:hypothetical protein